MAHTHTLTVNKYAEDEVFAVKPIKMLSHFIALNYGLSNSLEK